MTTMLSPELIGVPPPRAHEHATASIPLAPAQPRTMSGPILVVGTDPTSIDGALHIAQLLARRDRVNAHVLGVMPQASHPGVVLAAQDRRALELGRRHDYLSALRRYVHQTVGRPVHFSTGAEVGRLPEVVGRVAAARGTALVLAGLEPRGSAQRPSSEQLALRAAVAADAPVLAVPVASTLLPRRSLVAMDFSDASMRAARAALAVTDRGGSVTLAWVSPAANPVDSTTAAEHEQHAAQSLQQLLLGGLGPHPDIELDAVILRGDPASALLQFALDGRYDLIAMGSRAGAGSRFRLAGSVSASLLQGAMGAVLLAPPPEAHQ